MPAAILPSNEPDRIAALRRLNILDTAPEAVYDALTDLARSVFGAPFAALSLVDSDRQWLKSAQGLNVRETPRDAAFCAHAILAPEQLLVVPDAMQDSRFADNPLVTGTPGIRFYAGAPLKDRDGFVLGTLCVMDPEPREVGPEMLRKLSHIATGAAAALHLHGCVQELSRQAMTDPLTGLANRTAFDRRLSSDCAGAAGEYGTGETSGAALLMFDLDGFKGINDTFGHPGGDRALCEVADRLRRVARSGDLVARLGGDEFALVCSVPTSNDAALAIAARVHAALADTFHIDGQVVSLRTSIGIAEAPEHASDAAGLIAAADSALYAAKRAGRGVTRVPAVRNLSLPAAAASAPGRLMLQHLLREALLPPGPCPFELHYQPILDVKSGRLYAFEALARWTLRDGRSVSPGEFVPVAEEIGLVSHLDRWVLERACTTAVGWPKAWAVAVNISPGTVALLDIAELVAETLRKTGLPPGRLRLEITETMGIAGTEHMAAAIGALRKLGVTVAVDDFGSGHASLSYLRRYPFDAVKVDQSLVAGLGSDDRALPVMRAVVQLTQALGVPVVAEGVETGEQLSLLRELGVSRVQGYLLGRPVPENQVMAAALKAERYLMKLGAPVPSRPAVGTGAEGDVGQAMRLPAGVPAHAAGAVSMAVG